VLSSRAVDSLSEDYAHGMGLANKITSGESTREGSVRSLYNDATQKFFLLWADPSRDNVSLCREARASISYEQVFSKCEVALDDT